MAKSWFDMVKEGHFYAIDDEGNVVDFGKARGWEVETCYGCEPEVTLRVIPVKVTRCIGSGKGDLERLMVQGCSAQDTIDNLRKENEKFKKENEELRQKLANYESDFIKRHSVYGLTQWDYSPADVYATSEMFIDSYADNAKYLTLSTGRSNGKTQMLKEIFNSMYGTKAFNNKFQIKKVIFSGPCTIVFWWDGTKTMVRQQENDILDKEKGLAMAIAKKVYDNKSNYNNVFKRWLIGKDWRKQERLAKKLAKATDDICDLVENKASDEELKEAIDESKEIIDKMKE